MKSSLLWSISGVGLVAGSIIALSYWSHGQPTASQEIPPAAVTGASQRFKPTATDPWERGLEYGWEAAVAAQTATTEADWRRVGDLWLQAIAELKQVAQSSPHRAEVQSKIQQYLANFDYAEAEKAKARAAAPVVASRPEAKASSFSAAQLTSALGNGPLKIEFPDPRAADLAAGVVGKSAQAPVRVELVGQGDRLTEAKLILPKGRGSEPISMTDVVYMNHFLATAIPGWSGQSGWVATSLNQIQQAPNQSLNQQLGTYHVTIDTASRGRQVVVTVKTGL